jgi:hypothetical protein
VREREAELEQAGVGPSGERRVRGDNGLRGKNWAFGPKARRKVNFFFFFLNITKHFQMILNPNLNLNQTTHHKNSNATA